MSAIVLVLAALALTWRITTEDVPPVAFQRTLAAYVRVPGIAPALAWPHEGQAAVAVERLGSLGSSGASPPVPIASVAKVMTAYLTLLAHPLAAGDAGFVMTVTPAEVAEEEQRAALGQSTVIVRSGERLTEREALQALLLPSANNIAELLAVRDAGGLAAFVARMNATARSLGMASTTYTDPSGFDDDTVSTAADQLKLAQVAMREPAFAAIVAEPSVELPLVGRVANYDALVGQDGYVGVKTGSDRAAGGCLVFARRVTIAGSRLTVLGVVLGQREGSLIDAALTSAQRLAESVAAAVRVETLLPSGREVLRASGADGQRTTAVTASAMRALGWGGLTLPVRVLAHAGMTRLRAGERVATVAIRGPQVLATGAVVTRSLAGPSLGWRLRHLL